jgi:hypothetical protein
MAKKRQDRAKKLADVKAGRGSQIEAEQVRGGRKAGGSKVEYMNIKLNEALITGTSPTPNNA